ncbi:MAG TPA: hypothetical protein PK987_13175 [Ferruginibacter sp.]|nr:hypothetical protein [Ferruginibacter sp.]
MENTELIKLLNVELSVSINENETYQQLHQHLAAYINTLIQNDFNRLINYLYRIDVSEQKLNTLLHENKNEDAGNIIATLIIERQQQKIKIRRQHNQRNKPIDDDDKW